MLTWNRWIAELVTRILEHQGQQPQADAAAPSDVPASADAAAAAQTSEAAAAAPTTTTTESSEPQAASSTSAQATEAAAPTQQPAINLDEELEKRKARAAKFGTGAEDTAVDKKLERAQRFGTGSDAVAASVGMHSTQSSFYADRDCVVLCCTGHGQTRPASLKQTHKRRSRQRTRSQKRRRQWEPAAKEGALIRQEEQQQ